MKDYSSKDIQRWARVGWVINLSFAIMLFYLSGANMRAIICLLSAALFSIPDITNGHLRTLTFLLIVYMVLCVAEAIWLNVPYFMLESIPKEGNPPSFLLNFLMLSLPWIYTGIRWMCGLAMYISIRKVKNKKERSI